MKHQEEQEKLQKREMREAVSNAVHEKYPDLALENRQRIEREKRCTDAMKNSYLAEFPKIFEKFMLWPFVPGLRTSEAVTAGGRLILFISVIFCVTVFAAKNLPAQYGKYLTNFDITMDTGGQALVAGVAVLPSLCYYFFQKLRFKMCLSKVQETSESDKIYKETEKELEAKFLNPIGKEDFYSHNGRIASENLLREPIRLSSSLGGHPGVQGII